MPQGTIKKLVSERGFGFIKGERDESVLPQLRGQGGAFDSLQRRSDGGLPGGTGQERPLCHSRQSGLAELSDHETEAVPLDRSDLGAFGLR